MKILLVSFDWRGGLTGYCRDALRDMGDEIEVFYYKGPSRLSFTDRFMAKFDKYIPPYLSDKYEDSMILAINKQLIAKAKSIRPDLVLIINGEIIQPESIKEIKASANCFIANWWVDSPFEYAEYLPNSRRILSTLSLYDCVFIYDSYYLSLLREIGIKKVYHLPNAFEPRIFRKLELSKEEKEYFGSKIGFLGVVYPERIMILEKIIGEGVKIWGAGWEKLAANKEWADVIKGSVEPSDAAKIYNASEIIINHHHRQCVNASNQKTYEIAGCGGFQLVHKKSEIGQYFRSGEEMIYYESVDDIKKLIQYYLNRPSERKAIADRANKKALAEHTYYHRMSYLKKILADNRLQ